MPRLWTALVCVALVALACGRSQESDDETHAQPEPAAAAELPWAVPDDFEPVPIPADNPMSVAKVELGRALYFDTRLSGDGTLSCYSCHMCENGLTDGRSLAIGAFGKNIGRSAPSMWNVGYHDSLYWDGRAPSLEKQAMAAWRGGNMGAKPDSIVAALRNDEAYRGAFQDVFGGDMTPERVTQALSAYMRTILCTDTAWDRFQRGDRHAISEAAQRGWEVFRGKAACGTCHAGALFTDLMYHNVGIGMQSEKPDPGRFRVTQRASDTGAFKTPSLRDIARSAPYFHDGSVATLAEAVDLMAAGGVDNPHRDPLLRDRELTDAEQRDLVEFLETLSCPCDEVAPSIAPH